MSFENWLKEHSDYPDFTVEEIKLAGQTYEAGAVSRQAEIDELLKRINDAINCLEKNKPSLKMNYKHAINALSILKGE